MEVIATLALALGASWCAGINLYATVATLGLMHRFTSFDLPPNLEVLASDWVLWPALVMYTLEFVADKVPAVDTAWDTVHTFLRVPAGAALAACAIGDVPMEIQVLAAMIGGGLAMTAHGTKATARVATHAVGGSAVAPGISLAEDAFVITAMALVAANPVLAMIVVLLSMVGAFFVMRFIVLTARRALAWLFARYRAPQSEPVPATVG